jgi:glycosyltransferase involved in cell wall biosynthesis
MKFKLLLVLHFPPPIHGSSVVGGYIKESILINNSFDCRFINLGTSVSVDDIGRTSFKKLFRYLSIIWKVNKQMLTQKPDLCYLTPTSSGTGFYKDALIIAIVKLFRVKTIFHYHNKGVDTRKGKYFDNLLYKLVFRKADVILLSKHLYPDIQNYFPDSRVFYCPNGIPDLKSSGIGAQSTGLTEILFLSHLNHSKGVLMLIDACEILRDRGVKFQCKIAGGDADLTRKELAKFIVERGLASFIQVTGTIYGVIKAEMMQCADIFVHPSYEDCMPLVLLEAMQYSIPVVSTFEGAIPDVIEDGVTGFLVPQKDVIALADKLEVLIKDPELRVKMGSAGRKKYDREYTLEKFEKRMVEILKEVCKY